jgi:NAD(P)-dependent dehydrogenase (short-subunit alcohol dehydrogenase family)
MSTTRTILVVGATGKQGSAFVHSVVAANSDFRILALTRNASSPVAQDLASLSERVQIVQANLDVPDSVRKVFQDATQAGDGRIWGVLSVLAFPGLGADATGEENQGIVRVALKCFTFWQ